MTHFIESFLPLFVAINLPGILPIYIGLTQSMSDSDRRRLVAQALTTAFALATMILFAGQILFTVLQITVDDLRIGGGLILLILSITDLIFGDFKQRAPVDVNGSVAVVPISIPLTIGPAAITTILVSQQSYGYLVTGSALVVNLGLVLVGFLYGPALLAKLGKNTALAVAKVASLFLAAIAVAMIRTGVTNLLSAG